MLSLWVLVYALLAASPSDAPPLPTPVEERSEEMSLERYRDLIRLYREGDFKWTAEELAPASVREVDYLSEQLPELAGELGVKFPELRVDNKDLQAAVMLHSQIAISRANAREAELREAHLNAAHSICERVGNARFRREWLLAMGYFHQTLLEERPAVAILEKALREFPKDPELLMALGSVYESLGDLMARRPPGVLPTPPYSTAEEQAFRKRRYFESGSRRSLEKAENFYRKAMTVDHRLAEAHLRLGRVLHCLGEDEEGLVELLWVIANAGESRHAGLAHVFAGRLQEQNDHVAEAIDHYRAALTTMGEWQLAHLALSHALHRAGERDASLAALDRALQLRTDPGNPKGGYWDYLSKRDDFVDMVNRLREGVVY